MTKRQYTETQIPFAGFYNTKWSDLVDSAFERDCEYFADERQKEDGIPEHERLDETEIGEIYFRHMCYSSAYQEIARDYVESFNLQIKEYTGLDLGLVFSEMTSPREYNFETDKIYCKIPLSVARKLVTLAKTKFADTFRKHIEGRHRSRDGFHSFYSWNWQEWKSKPWRDFDYNELQTVLETVLACLFKEGGHSWDEIEWDIYYPMAESDYEYFEKHMDWPKCEADIAELRAEKAAEHLAEMLEDNPDYVPPYRCPETPDLFETDK